MLTRFNLSPKTFASYGLSLAMAFGIGIGTGVKTTSSARPFTTSNAKICEFSPIERYQRLKEGMSITQAELTLGKSGIEESSSARRSVIHWEYPDGSFIQATFVAQSLSSKRQEGLTKSCYCPGTEN